ncbi:MAG: hypothetical protein U1F25_06590 [Rubrivivax sp.]
MRSTVPSASPLISDLQLYTRRLHAWRAEHGSELAWNRVLGEAVLASDEPRTLDFMRSALLPG